MPRDPKYSRLEVANAAVSVRPLPDIDTDTEDGLEIEMNLTLLDADLAGTAHTLLNDHELREEHRAIVKHDVLRGTRLQLPLLRPGDTEPSEIEISHLPHVLDYARHLEKLRKACFEMVFGTRH